MDSTTKLLIIQIVLAVASRFFTGIAVYTDSKLTHIKHDRIVTAIVALLGVAGLGIYFIIRNFLPQEVKYVCAKCGKRAPKAKDRCAKCGGSRFVAYSVENRSEMTKKIIACAVIAVLLVGVRYWAVNYSPLAEEIENQYSGFDENYDNANYVENGDTHI